MSEYTTQSSKDELSNWLRRSFIFFIFIITACSSGQKILLVGTHHTTPNARLNEVIPIAEALKRFNPGVICAEYVIPSDTPSLLYRGGDQVFQNKESKRNSWHVSAEHAEAIETLQKYLANHPSDLRKRFELQQHYFLSHDMANADYQSYLIFKKTRHDSLTARNLKNTFVSYETFKASYEHARYRNSEYQILVFPLAEALNISCLFPIDDLSTWKLNEKHYERLQVRDTTDSIKVKYHQRNRDFKKMMDSLPEGTNQWIITNSPSFIRDLFVLEGYFVHADSVNEDFKMLHHYWVLRNKIMAQHTDKVARDHPNKNLAVFVGASHVGPMREELNKLKRKYRVLTLSDVLK